MQDEVRMNNRIGKKIMMMKYHSKSKLWVVAILMGVGLLACQPAKEETKITSLKEAFEGKFYVGAALNSGQYTGKDTLSAEIVRKHFNTITAENSMKSVNIHPAEDTFDFELPDQFVAFGEANNMWIIGHTLIWHSQAPKWLFVDEEGNDVSREVLIERMKTHIHTVVGRYKGRIDGWDVVNEAFEGDGSWRKSKFYEIIGEDFFRLAFEFAAEADPEAELYYNDYGMNSPGRRDSVAKVIKALKDDGVRIDGIGMQAHVHLDNPSVEQFEESILAFSNTGCKVMITEWDMNVLPRRNYGITADVAATEEYQESLNPYTEGLPDSIASVFHSRHQEFFNLFIKHTDKISRFTAWGVTDNSSWKNNWPIRGRTNYPLLFDRDYQPKPIVEELISNANKQAIKN